MEIIRKLQHGERGKVKLNESGYFVTDNYDVFVDSEGFHHNINDKAAVIYKNGDKFYYLSWYKHGIRHRLTGPAYISYNLDGKISHKEYWIEGIKLTQEEFELETNRIRILTEII